MKNENKRFVYTDEHPEYKTDPELNWLSIDGVDYKDYRSQRLSYVTVVDTKTDIVYTGDMNGGSLKLGFDVKHFVKGK